MIARPLRVMVVEADAAVAGRLQEQALAAGAPNAPVEVVRRSALQEAMTHLAKHQRMDLILLDLFLPDSAGLETLERLRQRNPLPSIVAVVEPGQEALGGQAIEKGAQDYLLRDEADARTLARLFRYAQERRRALDELRERREFSRLISQNVTDLIMVLDRDGRRVYHSPSYRGILGDLEFVKGSTVFLEIHPEDRDRVYRVFRETLATGAGQRLEYRLLLRNGEIRSIESQPNVIRDRWGRPFKMVVVSRDITERKQAEEALRKSEQRYKLLTASTTDYIFTVRLKDGRAVSTTHGPGSETLTGYSPADFEQSPQLWLGMVPPEDRPAVLAQVRALLAGQTPPPIEHRLIRKDGQVRWIRNTSVPRRDEQGALVAYDGLISDITERKQAEERLKTAYAELAKNDEALRRTLEDLNASHEALKATQLQLIQAERFESIATLAAGVAHEVKNPLQTMLMGLAYLKNNLPPDNQNLSLVLTDMRDAVKRADTIVRELLTLSASTHIVMRDCDFNAIIERSLALVNYQINASRVRLARELAADLPPVRIDHAKIEQVFLNLFLNAVQAMPQGGVLSVRTRACQWTKAYTEPGPAHARVGDRVVVAEVQDTGVGIPQQNLDKVFKPFFTTKPAGAGTGLGLSVAKQIIDLHGGHITIANGPGGGVLVTIVLRAQDPLPA